MKTLNQERNQNRNRLSKDDRKKAKNFRNSRKNRHNEG